jgi:TRAP-type transport system periplasmic protein
VKKAFLILLALVLAISMVAMACPSGEQQEEEEEEERTVITLRFITFWPSGDFQAAKGHKAYMDTIAARVLAETTDYEIKWEPFYAGTEKAADIYKVIRDGVYDIGATGAGYSPGVFPLFEAMNLPGELRRTNSYTMSLTKQALYDQYAPLQAEMAAENLHLCHLWSVGPGYFLMMPGKSVKTLADFPGKTFRAATLGSVWAITALGGTPVQMSMDEAKEQFGAGLLDGILCPTDTPKGFGLGEYVREVTFAPFSYDFVFMKIMNKAKYNSLPASVKAIFDQVNAKWSGYYGQLRTWGEADGLEYMKPLANFSYYDITTADPTEYASWVAAMAPVISDWIGGDATKQALWDKYVELDNYYATTAPYSTWTHSWPTEPPVPTFP